MAIDTIRVIPSRLLEEFDAISLFHIDNSVRYAIDEDGFVKYCDEKGKEYFSKLLYVWMRVGRFGISRSALRKMLGMGRDRFDGFIEQAVLEGALHVTMSKGDKQIPINQRRVSPGAFPGIIKYESANTDSLSAYKMCRYYYANCYEAFQGSAKQLDGVVRFVVKMLPYANHKYGILCENPFETEFEKIVPLNKTRMAQIAEVSRHTLYKLLEGFLMRSHDYVVGDVFFGRTVDMESRNKDAYLINPRLFYHSDYDPMIFWYSNPREENILQDFDKLYLRKLADKEVEEVKPIRRDTISRVREEKTVAHGFGQNETHPQLESARKRVRYLMGEHFPSLKKTTDFDALATYIENLVPHMNMRYNILCHDPVDIGLQRISPMNLDEIAKAAKFPGDGSEFWKIISQPIIEGDTAHRLIKKVEMGYGCSGYSINPGVSKTLRYPYKKYGDWDEVVRAWETTDIVKTVPFSQYRFDSFDTVEFPFYKNDTFEKEVLI